MICDFCGDKADYKIEGWDNVDYYLCEECAEICSHISDKSIVIL